MQLFGLCESQLYLTYYSFNIFCGRTCLHFLVPSYNLRTQMDYDIYRKSRIRDIEVLWKWSVLNRPDLIMIPQRLKCCLGGLLLCSPEGNKSHWLSTSCLAYVFIWLLSQTTPPWSSPPCHFISDIEKVPQPDRARTSTQVCLTPKPLCLLPLHILEKNT